MAAAADSGPSAGPQARVPHAGGAAGPGPPPPGGARAPGGAAVPSGEAVAAASAGRLPAPAAPGDGAPITARGEPQPREAALRASPAAGMRAEGDGGLERFCSPGKGRGLRALQPFQVGDLLFSCPAYAYVLTVSERGNHCEFCFAR